MRYPRTKPPLASNVIGPADKIFESNLFFLSVVVVNNVCSSPQPPYNQRHVSDGFFPPPRLIRAKHTEGMKDIQPAF